MGSKPNWTQEELDYLDEKWGSKMSVGKIAKKLQRSVVAVKQKAGRLGLGPKLDAGEWVSLNQLRMAVTGCGSGGGNYYIKSWVENRKLPVKMVQVDRCKFRVIYLEQFWQWAEENKSFLDFSKFERYALGPEPNWVEAKRKADHEAKRLSQLTPWTKTEEGFMRSMIKQGKTCREIARVIRRTEGAIITRCRVLGITAPQRIPSHDSVWTRQQYLQLRDLIIAGHPWCVLAKELGKSEKACRGRAYAIWGSENQDKLRAGLITERTGRFERLLNGRGRIHTEADRRRVCPVCGRTFFIKAGNWNVRTCSHRCGNMRAAQLRKERNNGGEKAV